MWLLSFKNQKSFQNCQKIFKIFKNHILVSPSAKQCKKKCYYMSSIIREMRQKPLSLKWVSLRSPSLYLFPLKQIKRQKASLTCLVSQKVKKKFWFPRKWLIWGAGTIICLHLTGNTTHTQNPSQKSETDAFQDNVQTYRLLLWNIRSRWQQGSNWFRVLQQKSKAKLKLQLKLVMRAWKCNRN